MKKEVGTSDGLDSKPSSEVKTSSTLKTSADGSTITTAPRKTAALKSGHFFNCIPDTARTLLTKKNNAEQSPRAPFQPEKLLKASEQESGFIVEQMQKTLFEQNYSLKSHAQHLPCARKSVAIVITIQGAQPC
jgi:hypothetical protein